MTYTGDREFVPLCDIEDLSDGKVVTACAGGVRFGVVHACGEIKVFFGGCPHHGGPLHRGRVRPAITASTPGERTVAADAPVLVCPWHSYEFDLSTGRAVADERLCMRFAAHELHDRKVCVQWPPRK